MRKLKSKWRTILIFSIVSILGLGILSACSTSAPPDQIGLYYKKGPWDGYHFDHCFSPATKTSWTWNNEAILLPASLRTWNIGPEGTSSVDSTKPIIVNSAPEAEQPSGVQISLWPQFSFTLNIDCGTDNKDPNSPIVRWWEDIGRRYYEADTSDGKVNWWRTMLENTIVPAAETAARSITREYSADVIVGNTEREEIQNRITALLQIELRRVIGADFYCSPTYDPRISDRAECGGVIVLLKDTDYTNTAVQAARDEKQAAVERAAAEVAAAQGRLDAANLQAQLYQNPEWVRLEEARLQYESVKVCAANPNCTIVLGVDGSIGIVNQPRS